MRSAKVVLAVVTASLLAVAACSSKAPPILMNVHSDTQGPDEFSILPPKSLTMPQDLTALPPPTPGGENLTDPHPLDDAITALGGKPMAADKVPAAESGLFAYATRKGVDPNIRKTLAAEDLAFRRKHVGKPLERLFGVNVYFKAYEKYALDAYKELLRWRKTGVRTPSAPPKGTPRASAKTP